MIIFWWGLKWVDHCHFYSFVWFHSRSDYRREAHKHRVKCTLVLAERDLKGIGKTWRNVENRGNTHWNTWKKHGLFTDVTTCHNCSNGKLKSGKLLLYLEPLKIGIEMNFDIFDPSNQWNHHESSMETVSRPMCKTKVSTAENCSCQSTSVCSFSIT